MLPLIVHAHAIALFLFGSTQQPVYLCTFCQLLAQSLPQLPAAHVGTRTMHPYAPPAIDCTLEAGK